MSSALPQVRAEMADVCEVTTIHPPFDARIYHRSTRTLATAGFRVSMICPWPEPLEAPTVRWTTTTMPRTRLGRITGGFRVFQRCMKEPAAAFHFHDLDFLPWAIVLTYLRRVPVVYDCHENYPEEIAYAKAYIPRALRPALASVVRALENIAARHLGWVVVAAPSQLPRFQRLGVQCVASRNLAEHSVMPELSHQRGVVCIGTLSETYGVWLLLDVARELHRRNANIPMLLTDRFVSSELREHFLAACEEEGLDVTIQPRVPPDDLPRVMSQASVGLSVEQDSPEKRMALPSKLFDYMAMGLPVVASDLPSTRQVVENAGSGMLAPPGDAGAFADAILKLHEDAELRESYRQAGFRAIQDEYRWSKELDQLVSLFRRALKLA